MLEILLVEDNPHDALFIASAFTSSNIQHNLNSVADGVECLDYLTKKGCYQNAVRPDLILLDIDMPVMDGIQVLKKIKNDSRFKKIPVVILTSSQSKKDIVNAYNNYANNYIVKPTDAQIYIKTVQEVGHFWVNISEIP